MFLGPALLFFGIFTIYPLLSSFYYSVHTIEFVGGNWAPPLSA